MSRARSGEARYDSLLAQIRELDPDVVFLQEVNPAAGFSARLARDLGFSHCHQVCIGGIKFGPLGIPANCKEGNAILARKSLRLQKLEDWKLSGSFGLFGDASDRPFRPGDFCPVGANLRRRSPGLPGQCPPGRGSAG